MSTDLRLGMWQDALAGVECDAIITDPPYGAKAHAGHDAMAAAPDAHPRSVSPWPRARGAPDPPTVRRALGYSHLTPDDVAGFVASWSPRCRGWFVAMTSHDLIPAYTAALEAADRYVFAPLPFFSPGSRVRLSGDGPSSWTVWIVVARPKSRDFQRWGTLPGGYQMPTEAMPVVGGKPLPLMCALVRDYSKRGDLVCDPYAGGGTTLLAAAIEGRRSVGAERDPKTHALALARLAKGHTPSMFTAGEVTP